MSEETPPNSVLEVKLDYIQRDIKVIKDDVKEMKSDYVTRREHETGLNDASQTNKARFVVNEKNIDKLYTFVYWLAGIVFGALVVAGLKLILKQ